MTCERTVESARSTTPSAHVFGSALYWQGIGSTNALLIRRHQILVCAAAIAAPGEARARARSNVSAPEKPTTR